LLSDCERAVLIGHAARMLPRAHAPYSRFPVGAAVLAGDDRVFFGCNVENASLGLSLCAERAALAAAVAGGARGVRAVVIVTATPEPATPCGACRQWIAELGSPQTEVICATTCGQQRRHTLAGLLPEAFRL